MDRKEYLRKFQREWLQKRRNKWLNENGPCRQCFSWKKLEVDHIDPSTKITNKVWSWKESRRINELAKCQVLCEKCHQLKSSKECRDRTFLVPKFDSGFCSEISDIALNLCVIHGWPRRKVANLLNINQGTVSKWIYGARCGEWLKRQAHGC